MDCETGGLDPKKSALLSIGAVEFAKPENRFYVELKPLRGMELNPQALAINDYHPRKWENISHYDAMKAFQRWLLNTKSKNKRGFTLAGHNPAFDRDFCNFNFERAGLDKMFDFHTIDLHSVGYMAFKESLSANKIYKKLNIPKEPDPHNAINGAMWEYRAFKKLFEMIK